MTIQGYVIITPKIKSLTPFNDVWREHININLTTIKNYLCS